MAKFILHSPSLLAEQIAKEREKHFLQFPPSKKRTELMMFICLPIAVNGTQPIKPPQATEIIIHGKNTRS